MNTGNHTILYEKNGITYKLCRIFFGSDGSFYMTSPYHTEKTAILFKATVNYAYREMFIPFGDMMETSLLEDDDLRLKISHHVDGFVQFSGEGIISGRDPEGKIKGIGVLSWPLTSPVAGPAVGIVFRGLENFTQAESVSGQACLFRDEDITHVPGSTGMAVEAHYFPPSWRTFIRAAHDGTRIVSILHPSRAVLTLKVLLPPESCKLPGYLGIEMHDVDVQTPNQGEYFFMSGSTGNARKNERGEVLADGIFCIYPKPTDIKTVRILNFIQHVPSVTDEEGGRGNKTQNEIEGDAASSVD